MKYTLAVFDLDGTILDTLDDLANSLNHALAHHGYPTRTRTEVRRFVGNGIAKLIARGVPEGTAEEKTKQVHETFTEHYAVHCADNTKPYDGILALLRDLRTEGLKTAVLSNKADYAVQSLCEQYFPSLFDAAAGEKEGIRRKPAPDGVNAVLEAVGIDRGQAVYIGDSEVDIETAKNAGMDCIIVDWGFRDRGFLKDSGADVIVSTPDELKALLLAE
ncbi:MAG: HAD family hydrolase [Ruminococcaceae bacterium]|nr:HAD family hydrolase [Oscillospiraceae bacterium]